MVLNAFPRTEPVKVGGDVVEAPPPPTTTTTTVVVTSGGDSGSEVGSDEGYRSLGIATTPPSGEKRTIICRDNEASGK